MKITNKYDMLEAMDGINEEYIRRANKLLENSHAGGEVNRAEITPLKFSWKSVAAAAACLVVLIGGAFGIKALMNKPVDVLTPAQQAYLDEWKEKIGANVNVAYAVDRFTFIEIELPEDVNTRFFADENRAVFIRDGYKDDKPYKTLEIYNIKEKTYTVAAELDTEKSWSIYHAEQGYVLYHCCKGDSGTDESLYLYDANTAQNVLIYKEETNTLDFPWDGGKTIANGKVYFTAGDRVTGTPSLYIYDIESSGLEIIENANSPGKYKDDIVYVDSSEDECCIRSVSGNYIFKGAPIITNHGLYCLEYGIGRFTKVESGMEIISAGKSKGIINLDDYCDFALQFGGYTLNSTAASENALGFIYYTPTDEIIVFQKDDGFGPLTFFGWGAFVSKRESDGTFRTFIVTDKESENAVKIPKVEPDPYLEEMKYIFGAQGSVDYARNKLDIKEYDIPGFEGMPLLVDKDHAVVAKKDNAGYPEIIIYDLGSGKETVLYSCKDDPEITSETDIDVLYANKDYVVLDIKFYAGATLGKRELRMAAVDGNKSYTVYTMNGVGVDSRMVIVDDTLYFNTYIGEYKHNEIYRYRIGADEKAEKVVEGYNLKTYNGKVYYYTSGNESGLPVDPLAGYTVYINFHVLDGELPFDTEKYYGMLMTGKCGIFDTLGNKVYDCVNDMVLLSGSKAEDLFAIPLDSMLLVKADNNKAVYDLKTGELLVFEEDDGLYNTIFDYDEFDGGMYTVKMDNDAYSKLCVITEKGAQSEPDPDPEPKPEPPEVKRNFVSNVPEAELSDMIEIVSEEFSLPEKILGYDYYTTGFADRTKLKVVLEDDARQNIEYGIYDLESGKYLTLLDMRAEPQSFTLYGQCGRYVYCLGGSGMWTAADIESDPDISKAKIFEIGKGLYPLNKFTYRDDRVALGSDGRIYFNALDKEPEYDEYGRPEMSSSQSALYRFDPSTGETEKVLDGAFLPRDLGNEILYDTNETGNYYDVMLRSLSGSISLNYSDYYQPSDNYRSGIILCGGNIFGMELSDPLDWSSKKLLKNLLTDEIILEDVKEIVCYAVTDNILRIDTFEEDGTVLVYFVNENKLVSVYKGDIPHIDMTYDGIGLITWPEGLTRDGKLYTFSMK